MPDKVSYSLSIAYREGCFFAIFEDFLAVREAALTVAWITAWKILRGDGRQSRHYQRIILSHVFEVWRVLDQC